MSRVRTAKSDQSEFGHVVLSGRKYSAWAVPVVSASRLIRLNHRSRRSGLGVCQDHPCRELPAPPILTVVDLAQRLLGSLGLQRFKVVRQCFQP